MKTRFYGCGISDFCCTKLDKENQFINGSLWTYRTAICFSQWLFKTKSKGKITKEEKQF
jgi:hypothetical protein